MMIEALSLEFMRNALLAGLLASVTCGLVGSLVVINRLVFLTGGIAHTAYGGIGLAVFLGISPLLGAVGFSLTAAALMAWISLTRKHRADTIIGVMWSMGMALGVVLMDLAPGYNADLMSYLFGSILAVPDSDLYLLAGFDLLLIGLVGFFYKQFLALSFDSEFAQTRGVPVRGLYLLLVLLIGLAIVLLIRMVGLILVIALITIGPFIAESWSRNLKLTMLLATLLSAGFSLAGLGLAYYLNLTAGPTIILVAGAAFFLSMVGRRRGGE